MISRKRLLDAVNHRQPDRVPVDFGGTSCSGMHVTCVAELREYYGLEQRPVKVYHPLMMLGLIEEDLKQVMGVDVEYAGPRMTSFGFPNNDWKEWRLGNGLVVLVPGQFVTTVDRNGDYLLYPGGDPGSPPSGRMPRDGYYFDVIVRQEAIDEAALNPADNLEEFKPISTDTLLYFAATLKAAAATGRGVVVNPGGCALGDIAAVPGPALKHPKGIRDVAEWYISMVTRPDYLHAVFDRQTELAVANLTQLNQAAGNLIDVIQVCGTDFGTQTGTFCSKETFIELYLPYYQRVNRWIHANTGWKTLKHSCGAVEPFLDLFISAGFDIVNPVQCSAAGMDPRLLKQRYGDRLTFWGGGTDTQKVLPFGTPREVRGQVLQRCEIFAPGGGYVFNAVHNVQALTPVENIVAMLDAVREFNGLPPTDRRTARLF